MGKEERKGKSSNKAALPSKKKVNSDGTKARHLVDGVRRRRARTKPTANSGTEANENSQNRILVR